MKCEKCAERRKKARDALLRAAMGIKSAIAPKVTAKTANKAGTAGKSPVVGKSEQEKDNG